MCHAPYSPREPCPRRPGTRRSPAVTCGWLGPAGDRVVVARILPARRGNAVVPGVPRLPAAHPPAGEDLVHDLVNRVAEVERPLPVAAADGPVDAVAGQGPAAGRAAGR